jgi:hypothetical protein
LIFGTPFLSISEVDGLKEGIENGVPGNLRENAEMAWQIQQRWAHSKPIAREGCIRHILRMPIDPIMGRNPKTQLHYKSDTFLLPLPVVRAKVLSILPSMRRGQVKKISPERQTP